MDWLSYYRAVIDCYEKIVRIPLPNDEILEVQGERPEKDFGSLACIKADEKKLDDIRVVRDFSEVFPDDLSGLPLVREMEFRIDLIPGASLIAKPLTLVDSNRTRGICAGAILKSRRFQYSNGEGCNAQKVFDFSDGNQLDFSRAVRVFLTSILVGVHSLDLPLLRLALSSYFSLVHPFPVFPKGLATLLLVDWPWVDSTSCFGGILGV
ncbi:hypothetical protein Tco_0977592 [Tanacetum coccineum]|uniref:Uncharacterized protein n=1 Tax=Tanacetum coccineum TaxID=301880 RepID=A0ABQ5EKJ0_9ASTR